MDRRQQKTRKAIFRAFGDLLSEKRYDSITVQDIIDRADVGRSTFYAHFETKDTLLEAMCADIFYHVFENDPCPWSGHDGLLEGKLAHTLWHVRESKSELYSILRSDGADTFMSYFKRHLHAVFDSLYTDADGDVPRDFLLCQLSSSFAETVKWWVGRDFKEPPETVARYFVRAFCPTANDAEGVNT